MKKGCIKCGSQNVKLKDSYGAPYWECIDCGKKFHPLDKKYQGVNYGKERKRNASN